VPDPFSFLFAFGLLTLAFAAPAQAALVVILGSIRGLLDGIA